MITLTESVIHIMLMLADVIVVCKSGIHYDLETSSPRARRLNKNYTFLVAVVTYPKTDQRALIGQFS